MSDCYKCVNFWREWGTETIACRRHGFYPNKPHTMPKACRDYEYDERKDAKQEGGAK